VAKKILKLAGVKDCWTFTKGKTKTTVNYAKAVFNALRENTQTRVTENAIKRINIVSGGIGLSPPAEKPPITGEEAT
jgi:small subunit ribosomal protein S5